MVAQLQEQLFLHRGVLESGEALVEPLEAVGDRFVIEPERVQDGRVKVSVVHRVLGDMVATRTIHWKCGK